ncbi:MAG: hypothetical protein VYC50_01855 [Pseudomonadota bacterium]|nr:hypothetical protein [Gammaproteobacteria bacterium]MEE2683836.1 hypothetical protein [Pseudomonadota bacterium]
MDLIPTSPQHIHILLNHFPSVGTIIAICIFIIAFFYNISILKRTSLFIFVILGLLSIPTYITGAATRWAIQGNPGINFDIIMAHQDAALAAFIGLGITGLVAWLALWQERRFSQGAPNWILYLTLGLSIYTVYAMAIAGNIGGHISRPELGHADEILATQGDSIIESIQGMVNSFIWAWPAMEAVHFIGMALIFGSLGLISVRILGYSSSLPFAPLHRLLPLGVLGFVVNIITGMFFFIADSGRYVAMDGFPPKIIAMMIGGITIIYLTTFDDVWNLKEGEDAPLRAKLMAAITILSWGAVIAFGRLLPYYGDGG